MQITTKSGRILDSPNIRVSTNRKCIIDLKKINYWMVERAKEEYPLPTDKGFIKLDWAYFDNDYKRNIIDNINPNNMSQSDMDTLFDLLLAEEHTEYIFELIERSEIQ